VKGGRIEARRRIRGSASGLACGREKRAKRLPDSMLRRGVSRLAARRERPGGTVRGGARAKPLPDLWSRWVVIRSASL